MITSSKFFKKTFFDMELENPQEKPSLKKNHNFSYINKTVMNRYQEESNFDPKNGQNLSNTKNHNIKDATSFLQTKYRHHVSQIQNHNLQRKNNKYHNEKDQFTIDVTPWSQNTNFTPRQIYGSKYFLNKERQKIKSTIEKYKFSRSVEQTDKQHANFIKSPRKNNKKINYIVYEYANRKSKEGTRKKINLIKNLDLNKSYQQYLNHEIQIDKDFLFKSHAKVKNHNRKDQLTSDKNISRDGRNRSLIEKIGSEKQFMDDLIKKDLICNQYADSVRQLKLKNIVSNQSNNEKQEDMQGNGSKMTQRCKLMDKGRILKFEMNRKIFKGNKISLSGVVPILNNNSLTSRQKLTFEISGNKTRKLQYSSTITN